MKYDNYNENYKTKCIKGWQYFRNVKDDDGNDKLSFVESELIVSEILLATAHKYTTEEDHDDSAERNYEQMS